MKVGSGHWKGLCVDLKTMSDVSLPEYPADSVRDDDHHFSFYVEVTHGQQFKISFIRPPGFSYDIGSYITVDGRYVSGFVQEAGIPRIDIKDYNDVHGEGLVLKNLVFGCLEEADDGPRLDPSKIKIDELGKIKITLDAGTSYRTGITSVSRADSSNLGGKAKKLLDTLVTGQTIGQAVAQPECTFDRDYNVPTLTLEFIYRTDPVLQILGVKPKTVTAAEDNKPKIEGSRWPKVEGSRKRKAEVDKSSTKKPRRMSVIDLTETDASRAASVELINHDDPDDPDEPDEVIDLTV